MSNTFPINQECQFSRGSRIYPQDDIRIIRPTHKFMGQITESSIKPQTSKPFATHVRIIDDAVMVESVDDKTRQVAIDYFNLSTQKASDEKELHQFKVNKGIFATVFGIGVGASASYSLAASMITLPFAAPAIACGIAAAIFGIDQLARNQNAINGIKEDLHTLQQHKEQWNDPIDQVITHRKRAGAEGFEYVFKNKLKHEALHSEEVSALWLRDFRKQLTGQDSINKIFSDDLLGKKRLEYAWDGRPLPDLEIANQKISSSLLNLMASRYQECSAKYHLFEADISNELNAINNKRKSLLNEISNLRSRWGQPALRMYDSGIEEAKYLYNNSLQACIREKNLAIDEYKRAFHYVVVNPENPEEQAYKSRLDALCCDAINGVQNEFNTHHNTIQEAYKRDCRMCKVLHDQATLVVDSFFDQRIRLLDSEVARANDQIQMQLQNGQQHFANLLDRILRPHSEIALVNQCISSPSVLRNWKLSNLDLEPSWNEVYGKLPGFQSSFANDVTESAWNLFWGHNGLGRYAVCSSKAWNGIDKDRSTFPFKQRWFNLHTAPQPRERMFCRTIVVPPPPFQRCPPARPPVRVEGTCPTTPPIRPQQRPPLVRTTRPTQPLFQPGHVPVGREQNRPAQPQCEPTRPVVINVNIPETSKNLFKIF